MRSLTSKPNTVAPDTDYPYGAIRDKTPTLPGTGVNEEVYGDMHQFFEKMMAEAGMIANNLPDNDYNGFQLFEALYKSMRNYFVQQEAGPKILTKSIPIGGWNMNGSTTGILGVSSGLTGNDLIISASATIIDDSGNCFYPLEPLVTMSRITPLYGIGGFVRYYGGAIELNVLNGTDATNLGWTNISPVFINSSYSNTGVNRGYVFISYIKNVL